MSKFTSAHGTWHEQTCSNTPVTKPAARKARYYFVIGSIIPRRSCGFVLLPHSPCRTKGIYAPLCAGRALRRWRTHANSPGDTRNLQNKNIFERSHLRTNAHMLAHHPTYPSLTGSTRLWHRAPTVVNQIRESGNRGRLMESRTGREEQSVKELRR